MPSAARAASCRGADWSKSGANFFKGAKVDSTRGVVCVAGTFVAIPHSTGTSRRSRSTRGAGPAAAAGTTSSEYGQHFRPTPFQHASMDRKPLMRYDPNAQRSRLATEDAPVPYKNASAIKFGTDPLHTEQHRWVTTNQSFFTGGAEDMRSHQATKARDTTWRRASRERGAYRR